MAQSELLNNIVNNVLADTTSTKNNNTKNVRTHIPKPKGSGSEKTPKGYLLDRMYRADPELFAGTTYATTCGFVDGRQPVLISASKQEALDKQYPGSYGDQAIPYGSTEEKASKNRYICPDIWCPVSEVSMTLAQLEAAGGQCPLPGEEKPEHYNKTDYFDGESRHIGFLDPSKHPKGLCLPCCFRKPGKRIDRCVATSSTLTKDKTRYVMHFDVVPLPAPGRMGVMPLDLTHAKDVVRLASSQAPTDTSFAQCIKDILGIDSIGVIVGKMDRFLALGDGSVCANYMNANDPSRILHDNELFKQFLEVVHPDGEYAKRFGLNNILNPYLTESTREKVLADYKSFMRTPQQTALIRELLFFGSRNRFLLANRVSHQEQDAIIDLINETNDFGIGIIMIKYDGISSSILRKAMTATPPSVVMISYVSKNDVCERVVGTNDLTSTPFFKGLVDKAWVRRGTTKSAKSKIIRLTHSSGVSASDLINPSATFAYVSDVSPYPDLQYEVDTRAFPVSKEEVARKKTSALREDMRRMLAASVRSNFYLMTEVNRLRTIATRPPQNFEKSFNNAAKIVKSVISTKNNAKEHVDWLANQLLLADEPLMLRHENDDTIQDNNNPHMIVFDEQTFDDVLQKK